MQSELLKSTSLYRLFDKGGCLLYIGITSGVTKRIAQHRDKQPWFNEVASATFEHFETRREAVAQESWAIRTEHPIHNKDLNRKPGIHLCGELATTSAYWTGGTGDLMSLPHCCAWMRSRRAQLISNRYELAAALAAGELCQTCRRFETAVEKATVALADTEQLDDRADREGAFTASSPIAPALLSLALLDRSERRTC